MDDLLGPRDTRILYINLYLTVFLFLIYGSLLVPWRLYKILFIKNIFAFSRYHIPSDSWEVVSPSINSSGSPSGRYGHSMIGHNVSVDFGQGLMVILSSLFLIDS